MSYKLVRLSKLRMLDKTEIIHLLNSSNVLSNTGLGVDDKKDIPIFRPFSVKEAKEFMKLENNELSEAENNLIDLLIIMATEYAEWYTGCSIISKIWEVVYKGKFTSMVELPCGPVKFIKQVYLDGYLINKKDSTVPQHDYFKLEEEKYLVFKKTFSYKYLKIVYRAGYSQGELPESIKLGILHHVASAYYKGYLPKVNAEKTVSVFSRGGDNSDMIETMKLLKQLYFPYRKLELCL